MIGLLTTHLYPLYPCYHGFNMYSTTGEKLSLFSARGEHEIQPITKKQERDLVIQEIVDLIADPKWTVQRVSKRLSMNVRPCDTQSLRSLIHSVNSAYNDRYSKYESWGHAFFARTKAR